MTRARSAAVSLGSGLTRVFVCVLTCKRLVNTFFAGPHVPGQGVDYYRRDRVAQADRVVPVHGVLPTPRRLCNATSSPPSEAAAPPSCPWVATPLRRRCGRISNPKSTRPRSCVAAAHTSRCPRAVPHPRIRHPPQDNGQSAAQTPLRDPKIKSLHSQIQMHSPNQILFSPD